MTRPEGGALTVLTTWAGVHLLENGDVVESIHFPVDVGALAERLSQRRDGRLAPEEARLLASLGPRTATSTDRRVLGGSVGLTSWPVEWPVSLRLPAASVHRQLLLEEAERALRAAWDPSVHVEEAVRAMAELDHTVNLLGERLASWGSRDAPVSGEAAPLSASHVAEQMLAGSPTTDPDLAQPDPDLLAARRTVALAYRAAETARAELESSVERALPRRAPNLSSLLGPLLAARMLAQAGGLDRLARLPASTVQVLGAEKAFFEHLRGRAPPPRHGLLFLHPAIQGAPRRSRGKLARALAGKVSIAARLDREGSPVDPSLSEAFARRRTAVAALPPGRGTGRPRPRRGSGRPLHRATEHR